MHEGKKATDVEGRHVVFGPTDSYTYTELLHASFEETGCTPALYGGIITTVDLYETVNARGTVGSDHTTRVVENIASDAKHESLLRALVILPEYVGVATDVEVTKELTIREGTVGSGEPTNPLGATNVVESDSDKTAAVK